MLLQPFLPAQVGRFWNKHGDVTKVRITQIPHPAMVQLLCSAGALTPPFGSPCTPSSHLLNKVGEGGEEFCTYIPAGFMFLKHCWHICYSEIPGEIKAQTTS